MGYGGIGHDELMTDAHSNHSTLQLADLPNELISSILSFLDSAALKNLNLAAKWGRQNAIPVLWRHVELVDRCTDYAERDAPQEYGRLWGYVDNHDDTPIIQKLAILAKNPWLASHVQSITHRCHLPSPGIFSELPNMYFKSRTISSDQRTMKVLGRALRNVVSLHTLRIIYGHWNITLGLLVTFLLQRPLATLRKLWLENVSLEGFPKDLLDNLGSLNLESIRLRRLHLHNFRHPDTVDPFFILARAGYCKDMVNGRAGTYRHPTVPAGRVETMQIPGMDVSAFDVATEYDARIYENLPDICAELPGWGIDPTAQTQIVIEGDLVSPCDLTRHILLNSTTTLTSLTLDWILWPADDDEETIPFLEAFGRLHFPKLKALQLRNTVIQRTKLPQDVYLLEPSDNGSSIFPDFLERHQNLKCLAWPMDRFYSASDPSSETLVRAQRIVSELARTLEDIRVDAHFGSKEPFTDRFHERRSVDRRTRRRRFVDEFAAHMTKVKSIKMEGGIPRDEKREIVRALGQSPLEKVVMIGVACPIGNTWGLDGALLHLLDGGLQDYAGLEEEDENAIRKSMSIVPSKPATEHFVSSYGWPPSPPLIHTLASYHASTVTEIKFCGYSGAPILYHPTPVTDAILYPLRHFHNLKQLVLSMWLLTWHEDEFRDESIIQFWSDRSSPSSTALAIVPEPPFSAPSTQLVQPPFHPSPFTEAAMAALLQHRQDAHAESAPPSSWTQLLETIYTPEALAAQVAKQIGPYLSDEAKTRTGGVYVRVSFCLGLHICDIFELDVWLGRGDRVLRVSGPRAEQDSERTNEKLYGRRWF